MSELSRQSYPVAPHQWIDDGHTFGFALTDRYLKLEIGCPADGKCTDAGGERRCHVADAVADYGVWDVLEFMELPRETREGFEIKLDQGPIAIQSRWDGYDEEAEWWWRPVAAVGVPDAG